VIELAAVGQEPFRFLNMKLCLYSK